MGCHFLLQEIFPTQGLNPGLPHCRQTLYCLSHPVPRNFSTRAIFPTGSWLWEAQVESQASLSWFHGDLEALCSRDRGCETAVDQRREKGSESVRCSVTSDSLHTTDCSPPRSSVPAGVGSHSLFQGLSPTEGSKPGLLHCRQILSSEPPGKYAPVTGNVRS